MERTTVSRAAIALLCVAQFVVVLDVTIVAVALPAIREDLGFSPTGLQWVVTAYGLVFGGFLMLLGRMADLAGRRRVLTAGFALFGAASLACGLARSPEALIAARAVQGLGAAAISPAALALLTAAIPPGRARTRALGVWTAAAAGGGALGWVLGGVLAEHAGWQWVFLVNVAPCALAVALAPRLLPESRDETRRARPPRRSRRGFHNRGPGPPRPRPHARRAGRAFKRHHAPPARRAPPRCSPRSSPSSARRRQPLLPPGVLTKPPLSGALLAAVLITAASTGPLFLCVLYLQDVLELKATEAGLLFMPVNLAVIAGSVAGARLIERAGAREGRRRRPGACWERASSRSSPSRRTAACRPTCRSRSRPSAPASAARPSRRPRSAPRRSTAIARGSRPGCSTPPRSSATRSASPPSSCSPPPPAATR